MSRVHIDRRTLLRGFGGIAVGLPALEIMRPARAHAQSVRPPRRFVVSYAGCSTSTHPTHNNLVIPVKEGPGYDITRGLKSLETLGIQGDVSIVSGLLVPWQENPSLNPL